MDPHRGQPQCRHRTLRRSGLCHKKLTIIMKAGEEPERSSIAFANKEGFMEYHRDEERFFELYSQVCYPIFAGGSPEPKQSEGFCERLATMREREGWKVEIIPWRYSTYRPGEGHGDNPPRNPWELEL